MRQDSVVVVDLAKDPHPLPRNYGVRDWHHNKYGEVSEAWFYDSNKLKNPQKLTLESREDQRWKEDHEDHMEEYLREGWCRSEKISMRRNYAYFCGGWDCDE